MNEEEAARKAEAAVKKFAEDLGTLIATVELLCAIEVLKLKAARAVSGSLAQRYMRAASECVEAVESFLTPETQQKIEEWSKPK